MTKKDLHSEICRLVKRLSYLERIVMGRCTISDGQIRYYDIQTPIDEDYWDDEFWDRR